MKKRIILFCISIFKIVLNLVYVIFKLMPVKTNKLVFCSRQGNEPGIDFRLIQKELKERHPDLQVVTICNYITKGLGSYLSFAKDSVASMYHMATSKALVLDSYWPVASMLNHREGFKIVQIWHAIGKIKQSGVISAGANSGRDADFAKALNMHEKNDYIIAGAEYWNKFYRDSFGEGYYEIKNYGLPRIDYLMQSVDKNRATFFAQHKELEEKTIILYVPTFRRNIELRWEEILDVIPQNHVLIIKGHPNQKLEVGAEYTNVFTFDDWKTMDLLSICDYVITDYSAISLEAAILNKPTYFWTYDYDEYLSKNGLNLNIKEACQGHVFEDIGQLMTHLESRSYDMNVLANFRKTFLPENLGQSTRKICDLIDTLLK